MSASASIRDRLPRTRASCGKYTPEFETHHPARSDRTKVGRAWSVVPQPAPALPRRSPGGCAGSTPACSHHRRESGAVPGSGSMVMVGRCLRRAHGRRSVAGQIDFHVCPLGDQSPRPPLPRRRRRPPVPWGGWAPILNCAGRIRARFRGLMGTFGVQSDQNRQSADRGGRTTWRPSAACASEGTAPPKDLFLAF